MDPMKSTVDAAVKAAAASTEAVQYLSFSLADEEYAVDILRVREIRGLCPITPLPQSPPHVQGVMNLRGAVVPVLDLRVALGLPRTEYNKFSVIVVLSVRDRTVGFLVDSVSDVLSFRPSEVESGRDIGTSVSSSFMAGIARSGERFVILLDIEQIVMLNDTEQAA